MKIISKIKIHIFFYLVALIAVLTGLFKEFLILTSIIIVHEIGHISASLYFKWNIDKIIILPFGGLTVFNEKINKPINEELVILLLGPIFQIMYAIIFYNPLILKYHYALLLFNLLPIYPLDGSKLINILFNKLLPFKLSHILTLYLSFLVIIICLTLHLDLLFILILLLLIINVIKELNNHKYIFNKFLLERYFYHFNFKKNKIIKGHFFNKMFRDYKHLFYIENKYHSEKEMISKMFDNKDKLW